MFDLWRCTEPKTVYYVLVTSNIERIQVFWVDLSAGAIRSVRDKLSHAAGPLALCEPRNDEPWMKYRPVRRWLVNENRCLAKEPCLVLKEVDTSEVHVSLALKCIWKNIVVLLLFSQGEHGWIYRTTRIGIHFWTEDGILTKFFPRDVAQLITSFLRAMTLGDFVATV